jgi:hypothetical protein
MRENSIISPIEYVFQFTSHLQDEETALHCAASRGHIDCVRHLLTTTSSTQNSPVNKVAPSSSAAMMANTNGYDSAGEHYEHMSMHELQQQINMQDRVG